MKPDFKELKRLYDLGFALHWLHPRSKRPVELKWTSGARMAWPDFKAAHKEGMNVGVRLGVASRIRDGYLAVIDCDVKSTDPKHRKEMLSALMGIYNQVAPYVASGRGNGSSHRYVLTREPVRSRRLGQSPEKVKTFMPSAGKPSRREIAYLTTEEIQKGIRLRPAWEISLMGEGQQVVIPPSIHPDSGKPYIWVLSPTDDDVLIPEYVSVATATDETRDKTIQDFKPVVVDLVSSDLPDRIVDQIVSGEGVEDRSAALLGVTNAMIRARFTDDEILSVLTDEDNFLGGVAFEHAQTKSRARAAQWIRRYTLDKSKREVDAAYVFDCEVEETVILSDEDARVQSEELTPVPDDWRDLIERGDEKSGYRPKNTLKNVILILRGEGGGEIFKRNEFANTEHYGLDAPWGSFSGMEITDIDTIRIKTWIADLYRFEPSNDRINEAIAKIADMNRYHPVREYLDRLEWDGVSRIDSWLKTYLGARAPEPYLSAISRKVLCAMIARIYRPGVKFDHVLILEGTQGVGKSTALRKLAGEEWFTDAHINVSDKDAIMTMRSMWLIELGELSGMRSADVELLKEFVSRTTDRIRVPYGKRTENFPRQCIFIGTTNREEYLKDTTGNRRFWPVAVGACDFKAIEADREQLLAEAKFAWELGEPLYLEDPEMVKAATSEQEARSIHDTAVDVIADWLAQADSDELITPAIDRKKFRMEDVFGAGGPLADWKMNPMELKRASDALRKLGFKSQPVWDTNGKRVRRYWVWDFDKYAKSHSK